MKKIITKADIKKMNLTEDEQVWLQDMADEINHGAAYNSDFTAFFQFGTSCNDKRKAIVKALEYFAIKVMRETGTNNFDELAKHLADNIFFTYKEGIKRYLRGRSAECESRIIVNDVFGLNYICIK